MSFMSKLKELWGISPKEESFKYRRTQREQQMKESDTAPMEHLPSYTGTPEKARVSLELNDALTLLLVEGDNIAAFYTELRSALEEGVMLHLNFAGATDLVTAQNCLNNLCNLARSLECQAYRLTSSTFLIGGTAETVARWAEEA